MSLVALAQYHPAASVHENLETAASLMERAARARADVICFSDNFLGFNPDWPDNAAAELELLAGKFGLEVITGRVRQADGSRAQSILIGSDGREMDRVPEGETKTIQTHLGKTLVLSEPQAYDANTERSAATMRPHVMIMQANAISLLELEAIKELAIDRSYNQAHLVICISVVGQCSDENCLGTSLAVFQGEILCEADTKSEDLVLCEVDLEKFIDIDELRDPVVIPELLRRKYQAG